MHRATVAAVAAGGGIGSAARYGVAQLLPHDPYTGIPWATFAVNATGCLLIGVLMVLVAGRHPLLRPFLGVGILGGYTTFSTWAVDAVVLQSRGAFPVALFYTAGTVVTAVLAVTVGVTVTRRITGRTT